MSSSADAHIGWGVSLHDDSEYGEGWHPSLEDIEMNGGIWGAVNHEKYDGAFELVYAGSDGFSYPVIFLTRSYKNANWGHELVGNTDLSFPSGDEQRLMTTLLDELGFTGDKSLQLLLAASYG